MADGAVSVDADIADKGRFIVEIGQANQTDLDAAMILVQDPVKQLLGRRLRCPRPEELVDNEDAMNVESVRHEVVIELETGFSWLFGS